MKNMIGRTPRVRAVFVTVLVLASISGLGYAYLDGRAFDWKQHLQAGDNALSQGQPSKQDAQRSLGPRAPSFDIASVDEKGTLVAAGRSEAGWIIQLKSKSQILGETKADENNEWVLTPDAPLPPGEHTLSLLAIDPSRQRSLAGERDSRVTVAPRREAALPTQTPVQVARVPRRATAGSLDVALTPLVRHDRGKQDCASAVVRTGDTLWGIAHHCYGNGTKYTKIFRSNRPLIRNPDLIYPAQRFAVPH